MKSKTKELGIRTTPMLPSHRMINFKIDQKALD